MLWDASRKREFPHFFQVLLNIHEKNYIDFLCYWDTDSIQIRSDTPRTNPWTFSCYLSENGLAQVVFKITLGLCEEKCSLCYE